MATSIGDLALKLSASPANLVAGLSTGEKRLNQFGSAVDKKMADVQRSFSKPLGNVKMPGLDAIKNKIDGINASAANMGKGGMGKGIGNALGGVAAGLGMGGSLLSPGLAGGIAAAGAVKVGVDFEKSMSRVRALTGSTGDGFESLRQLALKLGRDTEFSAVQAAEGMSAFALAGFKEQEILDAMTPALKLASAGQVDIAKSADVAATMLRAHRLPVSQLTDVVDQLAFAMSNALTDMNELSEANKIVSATARVAGVSLEEQNAMVMMLSDNGIRGAEAGTVLRNMLKKTSDQSDEAREMMKLLNLEFMDAKGNFRGFGPILRDMNKSLSGLGTMQRSDAISKMFEIRGGTGFSATIDQAGKYEAILERLRKGEHKGLALKISGIQLDNVWGSLKIMTSAFADVGIKLFETFKTPIRFLVEGFTTVSLTVGKFIDKTGEMFAPLIAGAASFGRGILSVVEGPMGLLLKVTSEVGSTFLSFVDKGLQGLGFMLDKLGKGLSFLGDKIKETFSASDNGLFSKIDMEALQRGEGLKVKSGLVFDTDPASLDRAMENVRRAFQGKPILLDAEIGIENSKRVGDVGLSLLKPQDNKKGFFGDLMGGLEKFAPGNLLKIPVVETVTRNMDNELNLQRLLHETNDAMQKQLASVKETLTSTTELTDGATLLEKAWHGVMTTTKDFAGTLDQMKRLGATEDRLKPVKAMQEQIRQTMLSEKLLGEKSRLFADTRTPAETFQTQLADISGLMDKGIIDADLFARSLGKLSDGFLGVGDAAVKMREATMFAGAAVLKGSAEAISITQRARFEDRSGGDKGGVIAQALEKLRKEQEAQTNVGKARREDARKFHEELKQLLKGDRLGK